MIAPVTGVYRDNSIPAASVPQRLPLPQNFAPGALGAWPRGEDGTVKLTALKQDGTALNLSSGTIVFAVRKFFNDTTPVISRAATVTDAVNGKADIVFTQADTINLSDDVTYFYDIQYTDASGKRWQLVPESLFVIGSIYAQPADVSTTPVAAAVALAAQANWPVGQVRYFFIDYDGVVDETSRIGYIDATPGTDFTSQIATVNAVKIKTIERFLQLLPKFGAGRAFVLLIKPRAAGATYKKQDGVTDDNLWFNGIYGYGLKGARGSDLTNSLADRAACGGMVALAGPNGDQSWTIGPGSTTSNFVLAGGQPSLPADGSGFATAITGYRVRFLTGALAGTCHFISNNGSASIEPGSNASGAPANGDTFVIERPAVRVNSYCEVDAMESALDVGSANSTAFNNFCAGIATTNTTAHKGFIAGCLGTARYSFCETTPSSTSTLFDRNAAIGVGTSNIQIDDGFIDETGVTRTTGSGLRTDAGLAIGQTSGIVQPQALACLNATNTQVSMSGTALSLVGAKGSYFANGATLRGTGVAASSIGNGGASTQRKTRVRGAGFLISGNLSLRGIDGADCTGPILKYNASAPSAEARGYITINDVVGSGSDVGLDVTQAVDAVFDLGRTTANTFTGAAGDIRVAGGLIVPHSFLAADHFDDQSGNRLLGSGLVKTKRLTAGTWFNVPSVTADPASAVDDDTWYRSDTNQLCRRVAGVVRRVTLT